LPENLFLRFRRLSPSIASTASSANAVRVAARLEKYRYALQPIRGKREYEPPSISSWSTESKRALPIDIICDAEAPDTLPVETINIVGPDILTGADVAAIWSDILDRPITYGGDDPSGFEQSMAKFMPKWTAYEMRLMAERYVSDGMIPHAGDAERLTKLLGRPLLSYRSFARALVEKTAWRIDPR
jgi:hypothetical protein